LAVLKKEEFNRRNAKSEDAVIAENKSKLSAQICDIRGRFLPEDSADKRRGEI